MSTARGWAVVRPGFGFRHPAMTELLGSREPVAVQDVNWLYGTMPLRISAFVPRAEVPDELITSIRCIVHVEGLLVVCEAPDGVHPWPGGRREAGETHWETARREVHEETGWLIEAGGFEPLGWLLLEHRAPQPPDHPYPNPDFCQAVYFATARGREVDESAEWADTQGWERSSRLMTVDEALKAASLPSLHHPFLRLAAQRLTTG